MIIALELFTISTSRLLIFSYFSFEVWATGLNWPQRLSPPCGRHAFSSTVTANNSLVSSVVQLCLRLPVATFNLILWLKDKEIPKNLAIQREVWIFFHYWFLFLTALMIYNATDYSNILAVVGLVFGPLAWLAQLTIYLHLTNTSVQPELASQRQPPCTFTRGDGRDRDAQRDWNQAPWNPKAINIGP